MTLFEIPTRNDSQQVAAMVAKIGPMKEPEIHATIPHCARNCAHSIAARHGVRNAELIEASTLLEKATVLWKSAFQNSPFVEKNRRICKCLCRVYLQVCGEVAERLKAAVC
jgi:hypothetical protein